MAKNIFIYAEVNNGDEIFEDVKSILEGVIDSEKYKFHRLSETEATDPNSDWASKCATLFVHNQGGEENFNENVRRAFAKYFLDREGKLIFLCTPEDGRRSVWFLKSAAEFGESGSHREEWPETVGAAFEKFSRGQSVPANMQALRIDRGDRYTDFSMGLVRGDSQVSFMYLMCEDGGSVVFVSGKPHMVPEHKSGPIWRDIMRVLRVVGVEAAPPHTPELQMQCRTDAPCFGNPHVLIYSGPDDQMNFYESIAAVIRPLMGNKYKVFQLKHLDIISPISPSPWWANCVALFVQNDGGYKKFDDAVQRALASFFLSAGKLVLFCNPDDGHRSTWLLNHIDPTASDSGPSAGDWSQDIGRAFDKFVKNEPLPSNVQCVQVQKGDVNSDLFVGLVRASDGNTPYMYLRCDTGDTAVFVGAKVEEAIERSVPVWLDILRLIGLAAEN